MWASHRTHLRRYLCGPDSQSSADIGWLRCLCWMIWCDRFGLVLVINSVRLRLSSRSALCWCCPWLDLTAHSKWSEGTAWMCLPECGLSRHMRSGDLWLCVGAFHGIDFIIYYNTSIDSRQLATCCRLWLFHLLFERSQKKTSSLVSDSETTHWRQPMIDCENLSANHLLVGH